MIGVIADDFTGAAEVAGAAYARGCSAELHTVLDTSTDADVVVVDTATRSAAAADTARARVAEVAEALRIAEPEWVFKKVDSLLRGHVAAEVDEVRSAFALKRAVIVPANPAIGRVVHDGRYLVGGVPLAESRLANDPEHPLGTSEVADLLGFSSGGGMRIPDAETSGDVARLAREVGSDVLPAGAAPFFEAMLAERGRKGPPTAHDDVFRRRSPALFVCGSLAAWRSGRGEEASERGVVVHTLPDEFSRESVADDVPTALVDAVKRRPESTDVLIAIGRTEMASNVPPHALVDRLAEAAARLASDFRDLFVEGGATAAAVAKRLGWRRLKVVAATAPGVVTLQPVGASSPLRMTTKAGSYDWPDAVWPDAAGPGDV